MEIELKAHKKEIYYGDLIITDFGDKLLVIDNNIEAPCRCSENINGVAFLLNLETYEVINIKAFSDIEKFFNVKRVIKNNKLKLMEVE